MLSQIRIEKRGYNSCKHPPSQDDREEILSMLNTGNVYQRKLPTGKLAEIVQKAMDKCEEENKRLNCHTVARYVIEQTSNDYTQSYGYLYKPEISRKYLENNNLIEESPTPWFKINHELKQVRKWLHHHSVILDSNEEYIECLSCFYPIEDFMFISHSSGKCGYYLSVLDDEI